MVYTLLVSEQTDIIGYFYNNPYIKKWDEIRVFRKTDVKQIFLLTVKINKTQPKLWDYEYSYNNPVKEEIDRRFQKNKKFFIN